MCIFCDIASGKIPCKKVYENDDVLAFHDLEPQAPVHVLVIPKKHYDNILAVPKGTNLMDSVLEAVAFIQKNFALDGGFRVVANTGKDGGQSVEHLHFHVLGGRNLGWPPG